jgi:transposase
MPRSSSGIHHQRQNSDNFILDANYHGRWFQPSSFAQVRFSFRFFRFHFLRKFISWMFGLYCVWIKLCYAGIWNSIIELEEEWWWSFVHQWLAWLTFVWYWTFTWGLVFVWIYLNQIELLAEKLWKIKQKN